MTYYEQNKENFAKEIYTALQETYLSDNIIFHLQDERFNWLHGGGDYTDGHLDILAYLLCSVERFADIKTICLGDKPFTTANKILKKYKEK